MGGNRRVNAARGNRKLLQSIHRLLAAERGLSNPQPAAWW